jgi:hypothetical protein
MFANYRFVNSTAIRFVAYDLHSATLRIIFQNNSGYDYSNIAPHVYQGLALAPSVGTYFGRYIRGQYASTRLNYQEIATFSLALVELMHSDCLLLRQ